MPRGTNVRSARKELERRRPVWLALSELFLDTRLESADVARIAGVLVESGYSEEELEEILFREVYPACAVNLWCPAGEWAGFELGWLEGRILENQGKWWKRWRVLQRRRGMIREGWEGVRRRVGETKRGLEGPKE